MASSTTDPHAERTGRVGAVVVSHDSAADLPACLRALRAATGVAEIVVVDNASRDGSPEIVRSFADPHIRLLGLDANTGFAGGCNRGFAALSPACGWVAFVNPDVTVARDCLSAATAVDDPSVAGVAPRLMRPDGVTVDSVGQVLDRRTLEVRDRGYGQPLGPPLLEPRPVLAACGALAVYRRSALEAVREHGGPWAEHYFCFWEDLELGWRLTNRGFSVLAAPQAVAVHGRGAGAAPGRGPLRWRRPPQLEACVLSNRWMTLIRHLHRADLAERPPQLEACVLTNRWMTLIRHLHRADLARRLPVLLAYELGMTVLGVIRRPRLLPHLRRRLPLVYRELGRREHLPRKRLTELPW